MFVSELRYVKLVQSSQKRSISMKNGSRICMHPFNSDFLSWVKRVLSIHGFSPYGFLCLLKILSYWANCKNYTRLAIWLNALNGSARVHQLSKLAVHLRGIVIHGCMEFKLNLNNTAGQFQIHGEKLKSGIILKIMTRNTFYH